MKRRVFSSFFRTFYFHIKNKHTFNVFFKEGGDNDLYALEIILIILFIFGLKFISVYLLIKNVLLLYKLSLELLYCGYRH